ncbi:hypothetical protein GEW_07528, partial [Pasteurella multocida subsp. gallicida str. Anand1_poultry]
MDISTLSSVSVAFLRVIFEQCQAFFTQLLTQYPQLFLLSLQIMKNEE